MFSCNDNKFITAHSTNFLRKRVIGYNRPFHVDKLDCDFGNKMELASNIMTS